MEVPSNVTPLRRPKDSFPVSPVFTAMAVAQMHAEGKLTPDKPAEGAPDGNR